VVATSIFSNTRGKVHLTLLHDSTLTDDNRRRFKRTAERWRQRISFADVSGHIARIARNPDKLPPSLTRGTLFRLLIPELLNVPKAIYLDCDIVVNLDIAELWNVPVETRDVSLAAVRDRGVSFVRKSQEKIREWVLRYDQEIYFNAGVLVMNLSKIRKNHPSLTAEIFNFVDRHGFFINFPDQDILNAFFHKDVLYLDERFNSDERFNTTDRCNVDNAIIHFIASKPWKYPRTFPSHCLFWKVFTESEWSDTLTSALVGIYRDRPIASYRPIERLKSLLPRLPKHLRVECLSKYCFMVLKELWYRLT
jgi:lipopolysaccharide biosynthesis glycosyltransferase